MAEDLFDRALELVMDGGQTLLANGGEVFRVNAAAFPDSGTPTTRSASTAESIARNRPALILDA